MPLAGFGNGMDFAARLAQFEDQRLKELAVLSVAQEFLMGLQEMHQKGIYHLDLKPTNIVLDKHGKVFIIDFGCAEETLNPLDMINNGNGDTRYCSPERMDYFRYLILKENQPSLPVSPGNEIPTFSAVQADAWAAGITLYELANNAAPFSADAPQNRFENWNRAFFVQQIEQNALLNKAEHHSFHCIIRGLLDIDPHKRGDSEHEIEVHFQIALSTKNALIFKLPFPTSMFIRNTTYHEIFPLKNSFEGFFN